MQPSIDLRLRTMMKALSDVVMPAIDPGNRVALEQAGIVLGSMDMLREQIDYAHWYEVVDLNSLCQLAEALTRVPAIAAPDVLGTACAVALPMASRHDVSLTQLRETSVALREAISVCVENAYAQPAEIRQAVQRLVLDHSRGQIGRERAYVAGTKWDGFPESLQSIEASLKAVAA